MKCNEQFKLGRASMTTDDGRGDIRMIAIDFEKGKRSI